MKSIFIIFLLLLSLSLSAQKVTADPAVGALSIRDNTTNLDRSTTVTGSSVALKVPVLNLSPFNPIPNGSTTLIIGLGSRMQLDPSFNLATARLSNYFTFSYNTDLSQPRIIGTQIASIPKDFGDSTSFQVFGASTGPSTASVNFAINAAGNVDDEDGNNNSASITYIALNPLPVQLTVFKVEKTGCNIDVLFSTEQEINLSRYEIEVSKDGSNFTKFAELASTNAGRYKATYPITESIKASTLYVRLKSIDKDGRFQYSGIEKISGLCELKRALVLGVYPNPVKFAKSVTVNLKEGSFDGRYTVSLLDLTGRVLQVKEMRLNNVSNFKLDIGNIAPGQYLLKVTNIDESEFAVIQLQKQ